LSDTRQSPHFASVGQSPVFIERAFAYRKANFTFNVDSPFHSDREHSAPVGAGARMHTISNLAQETNHATNAAQLVATLRKFAPMIR